MNTDAKHTTETEDTSIGPKGTEERDEKGDLTTRAWMLRTAHWCGQFHHVNKENARLREILRQTGNDLLAASRS